MRKSMTIFYSSKFPWTSERISSKSIDNWVRILIKFAIPNIEEAQV